MKPLKKKKFLILVFFACTLMQNIYAIQIVPPPPPPGGQDLYSISDQSIFIRWFFIVLSGGSGSDFFEEFGDELTPAQWQGLREWLAENGSAAQQEQYDNACSQSLACVGTPENPGPGLIPIPRWILFSMIISFIYLWYTKYCNRPQYLYKV